MTKRRRQKTPIVLTTYIDTLSHEGRGITSIEGKATFVSGAIAGEEVVCTITKQHRRFNEGIVTEVLKPSKDRTTPLCPHFGICGGCSLQHMTMAAQLALKQKTLLEQLKHFGNVEPLEVMPPISGNPWGYRRKARLGARYVIKKERMFVGFREKFSNLLADIDSCKVLHPSVGEHLIELRELIVSLEQFEHIPQIEVAIGDTITALIIRHLTALPETDIAKIRDYAEKHGIHIYLQPNPPAKVHKLWPNDGVERLSYALPDYNLEMLFHPLDFTQVNGEINPLMIKQALEWLEPTDADSILDLFCGLGNFTLPIARSAKSVVGVEGSQEMVERAQSNATHNQISNTEFYAANLMEPSVTAEWMLRQYDKILIDPPRTGAKEIIEHFPKLKPKRLVYVSCNPATLARDAGELVHNQGFKLKKVGVVNMFPHTSHIEAIALFER